MTTRREQILSALTTSLGTITGAGGRIYRSRVEPISRNQSPAVILEPVQDMADTPDVVGRINWRMIVRVTVYVRANVPDQAADDLIQQIHAKVMGNETLGGYALGVKPISTSFEMVEADTPAGVIASEFEVHYQTSFQDIATI